MNSDIFVTIRRFTNQTKWFIADDTNLPIVSFKFGIMKNPVFEPKSPVVVQLVNDKRAISLGAVSGKKLKYHDTEPFQVPQCATQAVVFYDKKERVFRNQDNGRVIDSADFLLLDNGLATAYWVE